MSLILIARLGFHMFETCTMCRVPQVSFRVTSLMGDLKIGILRDQQ